jgi:enoyl-CoA hydratase/carnithine racemase
MKKKVILTEFQKWLIDKKMLQAKAKRLGTTPDKLKAEEAKKLKIMKEIAQEIAKYKPTKKSKF